MIVSVASPGRHRQRDWSPHRREAGGEYHLRGDRQELGTAALQRAQEDRVRLRFPQALRLYQSHIRPRLPGDTRHYEFSDWTSRGVDLLARMGAVGVRYERDRIWIEDPEGDQWLYTPGLFGSALWAEYGVIYEHEEIDLLAGLLPECGCLLDVGAQRKAFTQSSWPSG